MSKLTLHFESDDAKSRWLATYLDGGGSDTFSEYNDFYEASWDNDNIHINGTGEIHE